MSTEPKAYLLRFLDGSRQVVLARSLRDAIAAEFEQVVSGKEIERKETE